MGVNSIKKIISDFIKEMETKQAQEQNKASAFGSLLEFQEMKDPVSISKSDEAFILSNLNEFKDYLIEQGYATSDIIAQSAEEILSQNFVDGKLQANSENESEKGESLGSILKESRETEKTQNTKQIPETKQITQISQTKYENNENTQLKTTGNSKNNTINLSKDEIDTYKNSSALLRDLYRDEDIIATLDLDGKDNLSTEEIDKFESYVKHKNKDGKLKLEDIKKFAKQIKDGEFDIEDYKSFEVPEEDKTDFDKDVDGNMHSSQTGSTGGGGNYVQPQTFDEKLKNGDYDNMTLEELEGLKETKRNELESKRDELKKVADGSDPAIKEAQEKRDEKEEDYLKAIEEDKSIEKDLKDKISKNANDIKAKEAQVREKDVQIIEQEAKISEKNSQVLEDSATIAGLEAAKSNLEAMISQSDSNDANKASQVEEAKAKLEEVKSKLEAAQKQKEAHEKELSELNENLSKFQTEKTELEKGLNELESTREDLEKQVMETTKSEITKAALSDFKASRDNYNQVKEKRTSEVKSAFEATQTDFNKYEKALNSKKEKSTENENSLGPSFDQLLEILKAEVGKSNGEMSSLIRSMGIDFHNGLYCAEFVTYALAKLFGGKENIPQDFFNSAHYQSVPGIRSWAKKNGLYNTDKSKVQPGDVILFGPDAGTHTGIIVAVNDDGTFDTIEGNGVGGYVVHRQHVDAIGFVSFSQFMR